LHVSANHQLLDLLGQFLHIWVLDFPTPSHLLNYQFRVHSNQNSGCWSDLSDFLHCGQKRNVLGNVVCGYANEFRELINNVAGMCINDDSA
jgi:hypothetical protein